MIPVYRAMIHTDPGRCGRGKKCVCSAHVYAENALSYNYILSYD